MNNKVLLVEDDERLVKDLRHKFSAANFDVRWISRKDSVIDTIRIFDPYWIVFDLILDDGEDATPLISDIKSRYKDKVYIFGVSGGRFIPNSVRKFLARNLPGLFCAQVYYLIDVNM